jgi:hypothetical protein
MSWMAYGDLHLRDEYFDNPRRQSGLDKTSLRELAADIGERGLMNSLLVTADGLILGGQRRYLAIGILIEDNHPMGIKLRPRVPVTVRDHDAAGDALADNLHRVGLSSYETAAEVARMAADSNATEVSRRIGKSRTYVSKMLKAWNGAGATLKSYWCKGTISYDAVKRIAALPEDQQARAATREMALKTRRKKRGGSHGRPGIDRVKDVLMATERTTTPRMIADYPVDSVSYRGGARDALMWASGEEPTPHFAEMLEKTGE